MLAKNILLIIGEPGRNTVLILDKLFQQKKKESLKIVYDSDVREYCVNNPKKAVLSPAAAVSETQVLKWYGVVKISTRSKKLIIEKDKMFDKVAKLARIKPIKKVVKPTVKKPSKEKSFESIFDSFLVMPKPKSKKSRSKSQKKIQAIKKGVKNGKPRVHLLQNSKKRNTKQKNSRGRKVLSVSRYKPKSKRARSRNIKKSYQDISRNTRRRHKKPVRAKPKTRKKSKRKTRR
jgi:hypothetical protein